jgi:hypothetical protein
MDISVDLPAPFSPMMPWIVPGITRMEMSRLACTGPKALEMPRSSMAGTVMRALVLARRAAPGLTGPRPSDAVGRPGSEGERRAGLVGHVVVDGELARAMAAAASSTCVAISSVMRSWLNSSRA